MKNSTRIFILLAFVLSSCIVLASSRRTAQMPVDNSSSQSFKTTPIPNRIHAVPFYSEDFGSGLPAGWTVTDYSGNNVLWHWTNTGIYNVGSTPGLDTLNSVGTTAANGYMIFDSDSSNGTLTGENCDLTSDAIDCSTYNVVHLTFNQLLYHFAESATVSVSNDGSSWTVVYDASFGMTQGQATPNPDMIDIDITAYAALQSTVYIRFNFTGDYDYWWMIDDVAMYEPAAADAGVFSVISPTTSCTVLSNAEVISVEVYNFGSDSISGFDVSYSIDGGTPVTENIADTIAPGFSYSYSFTATADLSVPGTYTISSYTSLSGDAENNNDTTTVTIANGSIQVDASNDYTMGFESNEDFNRWSIEDGNFDGNFWTLNNSLARTGTMCARMATPNPGDLADDWLFTPCLDLSDTVSYDLEFYYRTFSTATRANIEVMIGSLPAGFGMTQSIQAMTMVSNLSYNLSTNNFTVPFAGVYYIGFHVTNADSATSLRIDDINLVASSGVGVRSINKGATSIFPNPATNVLRINSTETLNNAEVMIFNTMGQMVESKSFGNIQVESIDISKLAEGQYLVQVVSDSGISTQRISIIR
ncbi:MAG TPA: T9SS type A sorting domain-containing protein [Bacteroidia bacterium]|nr:T9SS type A sorting domain-containing protein [Bacteroidia bacterium]HNS11745.1 T9SS type A sorting domain-containing protein [Bacteroidia bacterium]